jgi:hypothetical protein
VAEEAERPAFADAGGVAGAGGDPRGKRNHYTKPKVKGRLSRQRTESMTDLTIRFPLEFSIFLLPAT